MGDFVVTAREYLGIETAEAYREWLLRPLRNEAGALVAGLRALREGVDPATIPPATEIDASAEKARAHIAWGRWIGECPACEGTSFLLPDRSAPYMCGSCWNGDVPGRKWRLVDWPTEGDAEDAAALLVRRGVPRNRNWNPHRGESVADLQSENRGRGLPDDLPERPGRGRP